LRIAGGPGVKLAKQAIASAEIRSDGMSTRGRHGTQQVTAAYSAEASLGALDPIIEAIMRSSWDTNVLTKTQTDFTGLTTASTASTCRPAIRSRWAFVSGTPSAR
jgi:hypothetical protein